jgi:VCBS repeat-containing protein
VISTLFAGRFGDSADNQSGVSGGGNNATAFAGLAVLGNTADPSTQGRWQYSVSPGVWVDLPTGSTAGDANSVLLPTSASLRFQPVANFAGVPPSLSVAALDSSSGGLVTVPVTGQTIAATGGSTRFSVPTTVSATINPINDAPTIGALSGAPAFVENALTPVRLDADGNVTVADAELGGNWNGAALTVQRSGTALAQDVFSFVDDDAGNALVGVQTSGANLVVDGVTIGSFTNTGGRLTVTFNASATAALVGKAMGAVAYLNNSDAPAASAQINFVLNDRNSNVTGGGTSGAGQNQGGGGQLSATRSVTVAITRINDAPGISALDATSVNSYTENGPAIQIDANALLSDPELDAGNWRSATLSVARSGGANADDVFGATGTLSLTGSGSGNVLVSGVTVGTYTQAGGQITVTFNTSATAARADSVLRGLTYRYTGEDPPASVTLAYTVNDQNPNVSGGGVAGSGVDQGNLGALTASGSIAININRANDAPTLSAAPPAVAYTEQASAVAVDPALVLGDVDDTQIASASVTIASPVAGDLLAVTTVGGISASFSGGVLTLSGVDSVANYQQVLRSLVYSSSSDDPTVDTTRPGRSLTLSVTDANSDGAGARTTTSTRAIVLSPVNDMPTIGAVGNTRGYTENAAAVLLEPGLLVADVDDTQADQAVVTISGGFTAGDRLNFSDQNGISGSYDAATGVLTLTGTASLAAYQGALRSIGFDSVSDNPGSGSRTVSWTVRDVNSDAAANGKQTALAGTTTVNLSPLNDDPVAVNDLNSLGKTAGTPATGSVLANDSDVDGAGLSVSALAGGTPGVPLVRPSGTLTLNADGSYSFVVNPTDPAVAALGAGATLTETYTYTVSDGQGGASTATLTITINGSNNPPQALADANSITEGTPSIAAVASGVLANDSDLNADGLVVLGVVAGADRPAGSVVAVAPGGSAVVGSYGTLTLNPDGSYSYALDNTLPAIDALASGQSLQDTFTYVVSDGKGGSASANLVVTIQGANDPPNALPDASSLVADAPAVAGNALSNDTDPDSADTLSVSAIGGGTPGVPVAGSLGSLTLQADGSYSFVPNGTSAVALGAGVTATDTFSYTVSDGKGGFDSATITITLTGANDAPDANADTNTLSEDEVTASGNVLTGLGRTSGAGSVTNEAGAADTDRDTGDTLVVLGLSNPAGASGVVGAALRGSCGSLVLQADGSYSYTLDSADPAVQALHAGESRIETFSYTISDGKGGTATATLAITITGTNDAPVAEDDNAITTNTASVSANVIPNDHDPDGNPALAVTALRTGTEGGAGSAGVLGSNLAGAFGSLNLRADGGWTYIPSATNPLVTGLLLGQSLTDSFTYTVSDGALTDTAQLTITLHGTNQAPSAVNDSNTISDGQALASGNLLTGARIDGGGNASSGGGDTDPDGDPLTLIDIALPDGNGGVISTTFPGTPLAGQFGSIAVLADGSYQYTLDPDNALVRGLKAGETLTDSFVYTTSDGQGLVRPGHACHHRGRHQRCAGGGGRCQCGCGRRHGARNRQCAVQ